MMRARPETPGNAMTLVRTPELGSSSRHLWARCWLEYSLSGVGLALLLVYVVARIHGAVMSRAALWSFERLADSSLIAEQQPRQVASGGVDFHLWSGKRASAYAKALALKWDSPLAVLSIRRLHLDVPIFEGTDELTLNRGAGRIIGTARLGQEANVGIAAHRDGFFRGLKDIYMGDEIELVLPQRKSVYIVDNIAIVTPDNASVLQSRSRPTLTLVTCYPFYFVGAAPQRYIVQASLKSFERWHQPSEIDPGVSNMNNKEKAQ